MCPCLLKMNSEDGQWFTMFVYCNFLVLLSTTNNHMQSKHKQTKCEHSRRNLQITAFSVGIILLNQRIIWKDDIEFVTEFPCLLGHLVEWYYFPHLKWHFSPYRMVLFPPSKTVLFPPAEMVLFPHLKWYYFPI